MFLSGTPVSGLVMFNCFFFFFLFFSVGLALLVGAMVSAVAHISPDTRSDFLAQLVLLFS